MVKPAERPGWGVASKLIWVDVETTGIDPDKGCLLEVALAVTGPPPHLPILAETALLIRPVGEQFNLDADGLAARVPDFHLGEHGLLAAAHDEGLTLVDAAMWLEGWLTSATAGPGGFVKGPMCGASVAFDRVWIQSHLWPLMSWWTYRNLDVSSIREWIVQCYRSGERYGADQMFSRWKKAGEGFGPEHRAGPDLRRSMFQLAEMANLISNHPPRYPQEVIDG